MMIEFKCGCVAVELTQEKVAVVVHCDTCLDEDQLSFHVVNRSYFKEAIWAEAVPWERIANISLEISKLMGQGYELRTVKSIMKRI